MSTKTFALDEPLEQLVVRIAHGCVLVETAADLTEATVVLDAGKHAADLLAETVVERRGRALVVVAPRQGGIFDLPIFPGRRAGAGIDVKITVPPGLTVKISTYTAPIRIAGTVGDADLAFGAGEAAVREVTGDLRLRFGSGTAKAVHVHGSVELRSGAGSAQFGEIDGDLRSGSGSGDLQARRVHGAVRSRCGSGAARLEAVHGDVDVVSGSGDLAIGLPAGITARVDVHTGSGRVHSDLPVDDKPASQAGAISVRARTGSGDVHFFRAA